MKKISLFLVVLLGIFVFVSCSSDNESEKLSQLTVQLSSSKKGVDYSNFTVKLTESRSGQQFVSKANTTGLTTFNVPLGQYDIAAEDALNGASTMYGSQQNFTFSEANRVCKLEVKDLQASMAKTFVLDELFFNCSKAGEYNNLYYEEYFTIRNVSERSLYADGLSFAICGDYNAIEDDGEKSAYLKKDEIVVSQLYTIPGNGREHLVKPGESLVIAHSAIDHSEGGIKKGAVNLTGADFEIYVPYEYSMTTDNAEVPNLTVNYSMFQAFSWGYTGYAPLMLLRADENLTDYVPKHLESMKVTGAFGNKKQNYLVIPTRWIIDAAETGCKDNFLHKVLPVQVDKSSIQVQDDGLYGGFKSLFVQRKPANKGYLQDTNDSENDFVIVPNGQKNYPKK